MQEFQNIKTFSHKVTFEIGQNKFLLMKKLKILRRGHMLFMILFMKELLECFKTNNSTGQFKLNLG